MGISSNPYPLSPNKMIFVALIIFWRIAECFQIASWMEPGYLTSILVISCFSLHVACTLMPAYDTYSSPDCTVFESQYELIAIRNRNLHIHYSISVSLLVFCYRRMGTSSILQFSVKFVPEQI